MSETRPRTDRNPASDGWRAPSPQLGLASDAPQPAEDERDELEAALEELGADTTAECAVYVSKWNADSTARHGFDLCGRYAAAGFDPYRIPREFGAGRFNFRFVRGGRYVRNIERTFILPAPTPHSATGSPARDELQEELRESRKFERQMLLTVLAGVVGRPAGAAAGPAAPTFAEMLSIFTAGREAASAAPTPLEAIREAISYGRELAGDFTDEDGPRGRRPKPPSLLDRFGDRALGLVELALTKNATAPPTPALPAGVASPTATPAAAAAPPADPLVSFVKQFAPALMAEAQAGHDARSYGSHVAERCPEPMLDQLGQFAEATADERLAFLGAHAPELVAYQGWIDEACAGVLDVLGTDDEDKGETDGAA